MDISALKAVVFDCDGVMFDTALANRKFYDEILAAFDKPSMTQKQFHNVHMMTVKAAIEYLFPDVDDYSPIYEIIKSIRYAKFTPYMKREKGLKKLLAALKENGLIRGIATNRTNTMESVLIDNDMTTLFEIVVTAADVDHPKPAPDQLHKIMAEFNLSPEEIIFVGDSEYDQRAAQAAGTWFIAFRQPNLDAHFHAVSMAEVGEFLQINK
ncbi:MAG: HAD-IA family hydrolase [Desulfobacter sp.]